MNSKMATLLYESEPSAGVGTTVYLTGVPRSGTTFLARALAADATVAYCHEPFNWDGGLVDVDFRFTRPSASDLDAALDSITSGRARFRTAVYDGQDGRARRAAKRVVGSRSGFDYRLARLNPVRRHWVIKDPTAPFVMAVATQRLDAAIVVIRHPAALVESFRRLGWDAENDCRRTAESLPGLDLSSALVSFFDERWRTAPVAARVTALWRAAIEVAENTPLHDAHLVRYEDLASAPIEQIPVLANRVGLPFGRIAMARLRWSTGGRQGLRVSGRTQALRRDSASIVRDAGRSVPDDERSIIEAVGADVLERWYPSGSRAR